MIRIQHAERAEILRRHGNGPFEVSYAAEIRDVRGVRRGLVVGASGIGPLNLTWPDAVMNLGELRASFGLPGAELRLLARLPARDSFTLELVTPRFQLRDHGNGTKVATDEMVPARLVHAKALKHVGSALKPDDRREGWDQLGVSTAWSPTDAAEKGCELARKVLEGVRATDCDPFKRFCRGCEPKVFAAVHEQVGAMCAAYRSRIDAALGGEGRFFEHAHVIPPENPSSERILTGDRAGVFVALAGDAPGATLHPISSYIPSQGAPTAGAVRAKIQNGIGRSLRRGTIPYRCPERP